MVVTRDFVSIEVGGIRLNRWTHYSVDSDLLTPADAFDLAVDVPTGDQEFARTQVSPGAEVKLYAEREDERGRTTRALQLTGWIDERAIMIDREGGLQLRVKGKDRAKPLVDSNVPPGLIREDASGSTVFVDLVRAAVSRWGIEVVVSDTAERSILTGERQRATVTRLERREARAEGVNPRAYSRARLRAARAATGALDTTLGTTATSGPRYANGYAPSDVARLTVEQARPRVGETVWSFLARHAARLGLLMWFTADGKLVVGSPDYGQEASYRLIRRVRESRDDPNTIVEGGETLSIASAYSAAIVYGRTGGTDASLSRIRGVARDDEWPGEASSRLDVIRYVYDPAVRDVESADRRAQREIAATKVDRRVLDYVVDGHGQNGILWAANRTAFVDDERLGVRGVFFIVSRTFVGDRSGGTMTRLRLVPRGAITL